MPNITGSWSSLTESDFTMLQHPGTPADGYLHFRDQFRLPGQVGLITYRDPMTSDDTGENVRVTIEAQALVHGWPLIGIYISGAGHAPHFAVNRSDFPSQTGNPEIRAEKLQNTLDIILEGIYKSSAEVTDPTDPLFGQVIDSRNFWVTTHFYRYAQDGLYVPGDFVFRVGKTQPRPNWWK